MTDMDEEGRKIVKAMEDSIDGELSRAIVRHTARVMRHGYLDHEQTMPTLIGSLRRKATELEAAYLLEVAAAAHKKTTVSPGRLKAFRRALDGEAAIQKAEERGS